MGDGGEWPETPCEIEYKFAKDLDEPPHYYCLKVNPT
jgi:hypothetical protein